MLFRSVSQSRYNAAGLYAQFPGDGYMHIYSYWDTSGYSYNILMPVTTNPVYIRTQRDPVAMTQSVEAWNYLGQRFYSNSQSITDTADATGGIIVGAATIDTAFFRVHNTLVPMNSNFDTINQGLCLCLSQRLNLLRLLRELFLILDLS